MASMTVTLSDSMKVWVEQQARKGRYGDPGDYVRALIRQDQDRAEKIDQIQRLVTEGLESGTIPDSLAQIRAEARRKAGISPGSDDAP